MASSGAVAYTRPYSLGSYTSAVASGAVAYTEPRSVSGIFTAGAGVSDEANATSAKAMYPGPRVQMVDDKGYITQPWDRFFRWILNDKLGGVSAPSVADISNSITSVQQAVTTTVATVNSVTETVVQNAAALDTVREVARDNGLTGSSQIPRVSRYPQLIA